MTTTTSSRSIAKVSAYYLRSGSSQRPLASTMASGSFAKHIVPPSTPGSAQRPNKRQRRQEPVTRVNEPPAYLLPAKDHAFCVSLDNHIQMTQEETDEYLDRKWFTVQGEYLQNVINGQNDWCLEATKTYTYTEIEEELCRKELRKERIHKSTAADWATWSKVELMEAWDAYCGFPVPCHSTKEELLKGIEFMFIRVRLDEDAYSVGWMYAEDHFSISSGLSGRLQ
jgi:hypothetical protein